MKTCAETRDENLALVHQDADAVEIHRDTVRPDWRSDRPAEDPYKLKAWGFIAAKPSEYLVHYRRGRLRERSSGQGATCFKLPWDTVAILPTSFKEVTFEANQITSDNVDVRIRGMAVYHVADPLKTYTLVNFSFRERAEAKLAATITDICRSTAKWLVANMTVDECIRRRREEIAESLKNEVSRVITAGESGWGLALDTIHIQDVFVVDDAIFEAMQQNYKARALMDAELARLEMDKKLRTEQVAAERLAREQKVRLETEMADIERDAATRKAMEDAKARERVAEAEKERRIREADCEAHVKLKAVADAERQQAAEIEVQKRTSLDRVAADEEVARRELSKDAEVARAKKESEVVIFDLDRYRVENNEGIATYKVEAAERRETEVAEAERGRAMTRLEVDTAAHAEEVGYRRSLREIENAVAEGRLTEQFVSEALPEIARAFSAQFGRIHVMQISGGNGHGAGAMSPLVTAFAQLLEVAKGQGIDLGALLNRKQAPEGADHPPADDRESA
ncbi:MAG: hypothetical protein HY897_00310 [Deltaproteobacteria bacterium]|nr:hypothetical protein [Deltaproteobacteria bacterium]